MIDPATIVPLVAFALLPIETVYLIIRVRLIKKSMGEREESLARRLRKQFFGVMFCTPILIALNYIREFDLIVRIAISGVGVLGFYIAVHDMLFSLIGGIYRNGIVWYGAWVLFKDIDCIELVDPYTLVIQLKDRTRKVFAPGTSAPVEHVAALITARLAGMP